jgi:hypothetical protein
VNRLRALTLAVIGLGLAAAGAQGNSIASVVVDDRGAVYFTDYVGDKIWKVDGNGVLGVALDHRHTFHLVRDIDGANYGESRPSRRSSEATIWRLESDGRSDDVFRAVPRGRNASYRGTVFTIDGTGNLLVVRDWQLVRLTVAGRLEPITATPPATSSTGRPGAAAPAR